MTLTGRTTRGEERLEARLEPRKGARSALGPCGAIRRVALAATVAAMLACSGSESDSSGAGTANSPPGTSTTATSSNDGSVDLVKRGRSVYMANCIACHSTDPAADGALGPAVAGSSRELLEARVLRAEYPPGYVPKRDSKLMVAMAHLEREIEALHAFLNQGG